MENEQINNANPINNLADTVTQNVTNTYSKIFGDPSVARKDQEENRNSFEDVRNNSTLRNKQEENVSLAGTNKTIQNMTNMLTALTENLEEKDNNNQPQINLEKMVDFFKNNENENTNDEPQQTPMIPQSSRGLQSDSLQQQTPNSSTQEQKKSNPREDFHKKMYDSIYQAAIEKGLQNADVLARLGASQASLESGHGKKMPKDSNNPFGIKETRKDKPSSTNETREVVDDKNTNKREKFRKYEKVEDSAKDWMNLVEKDPRYKDVLKAKDFKEASDALGKSGYFTENPEKYLKDIKSISDKYGKNIQQPQPTQMAQQLPQKEEKSSQSLTSDTLKDRPKEVAQVQTQEAKPQLQSSSFTPGEQNYGKVTLNPQGQPSAEKESTNDSPINQPYMMQQQGSLTRDFNLQTMPATGMAIPEQTNQTQTLAEMQQPQQRQTGMVLSSMSDERQTTRDQMNQPQAPVINNINNGGGGNQMQTPPQSSAANAPVAGVRNEDNTLMRVQNMMGIQSMS